MQHYAVKFVSDLRHVGGFLRVLQLPPPINPNPIQGGQRTSYIRVF